MMHKFARSHVGHFLRGRTPPEGFVSVRMSAKARNDVAVPPRLLQPELSDGTEMLRAIVQSHLDEFGSAIGAFQVARPLRVYQGKRKEHPLPVVTGRCGRGEYRALAAILAQR